VLLEAKDRLFLEIESIALNGTAGDSAGLSQETPRWEPSYEPSSPREEPLDSATGEKGVAKDDGGNSDKLPPTAPKPPIDELEAPAEEEDDSYEVVADVTSGDIPYVMSRATGNNGLKVIKLGNETVYQVLMVVVTVPNIKPGEFRRDYVDKYADVLSSKLKHTLGMPIKVQVSGLQGEDTGSGVFTQILFGNRMTDGRLHRFVNDVVKKDFGSMFSGLFGRVRCVLLLLSEVSLYMVNVSGGHVRWFMSDDID